MNQYVRVLSTSLVTMKRTGERKYKHYPKKKKKKSNVYLTDLSIEFRKLTATNKIISMIVKTHKTETYGSNRCAGMNGFCQIIISDTSVCIKKSK